MLTPPEQHQTTGLKLIAPIVVLACGHMLSTLIRTLPAVSIDLIATDLQVNAATVGSLAGAYHFAFAAGQIPLGVALDRFSVRTVSISLLLGNHHRRSLCRAVAHAAGNSAWPRSCSAFHLGHVALPSDVCSAAPAVGEIRPVDRHHSQSRQLRDDPLCQSAGVAGRQLRLARRLLALRRGVRLHRRRGLLPPYSAMHRARQATRGIADETWGVFRLGLSRELRGVVILAFFSVAIFLIMRGVWVAPG